MTLKSLYHYTRADIAKKIILDTALKLSMYPKVNDPFDMAKDIIYHPEENGEELYNAICTDTELHRIRPAYKYFITQAKKSTTAVTVHSKKKY